MIAFFDANGMIYREFIPQRAEVSGERYLEILRRFCVSMSRKRPQRWEQQDFTLQHDGAPAHRCDEVVQFLARNNTEVLPHPGYSPDLAPCDFWLFAWIKKHTKGQRFASVDELCKTIDSVIKSIPECDYHRAIYNLPGSWIKCSEADGGYFE